MAAHDAHDHRHSSRCPAAKRTGMQPSSAASTTPFRLTKSPGGERQKVAPQYSAAISRISWSPGLACFGSASGAMKVQLSGLARHCCLSTRRSTPTSDLRSFHVAAINGLSRARLRSCAQGSPPRGGVDVDGRRMAPSGDGGRRLDAARARLVVRLAHGEARGAPRRRSFMSSCVNMPFSKASVARVEKDVVDAAARASADALPTRTSASRVYSASRSSPSLHARGAEPPLAVGGHEEEIGARRRVRAAAEAERALVVQVADRGLLRVPEAQTRRKARQQVSGLGGREQLRTDAAARGGVVHVAVDLRQRVHVEIRRATGAALVVGAAAVHRRSAGVGARRRDVGRRCAEKIAEV